MIHFNSYSQKIVTQSRLSCKVEVEYSESTGYKKSDNSDLVVEVKEFPKRKSIILKSPNKNANNISVNIGTEPVVINGYIEINNDKTDDDKYEINSNVATRSNTQSDTTIYLNKKMVKLLFHTITSRPMELVVKHLSKDIVKKSINRQSDFKTKSR
jgi:hypothetical protein